MTAPYAECGAAWVPYVCLVMAAPAVTAFLVFNIMLTLKDPDNGSALLLVFRLFECTMITEQLDVL